MKKLSPLVSILVFMLCLDVNVSAQNDSLAVHIDSLKMNLNPRRVPLDSLILVNGDIIVGEMKTMDKGVLTMETPYSDKDFTIKWIKIKQVHSVTQFLIVLGDGRRMNSNIRSRPNAQVVLKNEDGDTLETLLPDIVYLKELESTFWSRLKASVDLGYNLTKAQHLRQLTFSTSLGYLTNHWSIDFYFTDNRSRQDSITPTKRDEAGATYRYYLKRDWYIIPQVNYLSNTEQALKERITSKLGAGRFMFHTNKSYWGIVAGVNLNAESFTNETESRNSAEVYGGTELNLFDTGDFSIYSTLYLYPSMTEKGRVRSDFKIDTKYEFAKDFYVKLNLTLNYDNRPAIEGNETDYVFGVSLGWDL